MPNMDLEFNRLMLEIEKAVLESLQNPTLRLQCPQCGQHFIVPLNGQGEGQAIVCGCGTLVSLDQA